MKDSHENYLSTHEDEKCLKCISSVNDLIKQNLITEKFLLMWENEVHDLYTAWIIETVLNWKILSQK